LLVAVVVNGVKVVSDLIEIEGRRRLVICVFVCFDLLTVSQDIWKPYRLVVREPRFPGFGRVQSIPILWTDQLSKRLFVAN
jgi:hypothetical protein